MQRRTLFWQVFPAYVLLSVGLLVLLLLESRGRLRDFYADQTASNLTAGAVIFADAAEPALKVGKYAEVDAMAKRLSKLSGLRITVIMPDGKVVAESSENPEFLDNHRRRPEIATALDTRLPAHGVRHSATLDCDFLYVAVPLVRNKEAWAVVRVSASAAAMNEVLGAFERRVLYGAMGAAGIILLISWLISRRISRPLEAITRGAERFGGGELDCRLPIRGSREIATLAQAFNDLGQQLGEHIQAAAVQRSEQESILFSMEEGVLTLDNQGKILDMNRAASQMFHLDPDKSRGRPIHESLRKADVLKFVENALAGSLPLQAELVLYDKEKHTLTAYANALCNARNERIGLLIVFHRHA